MMVRKSRVEIVICYRGGEKVLAAAPFVGVVLGAGGPEKTEGSGADGTRAEREVLGLRVPEPEGVGA